MIKLFLDTDFGPDCDDAGALQLVHCLCDAGEAELIGVTHCTGNPYGLPAISALNRFNGREVPLGTTKRDFLSAHDAYNRPMSEHFLHEFSTGRLSGRRSRFSGRSCSGRRTQALRSAPSVRSTIWLISSQTKRAAR